MHITRFSIASKDPFDKRIDISGHRSGERMSSYEIRFSDRGNKYALESYGSIIYRMHFFSYRIGEFASISGISEVMSVPVALLVARASLLFVD